MAEKKESTKEYRLTLPRDFPQPSRNRGGVSVLAGPEGSVVALDADQLEAINADPLITVEPVKAEKAETKSTSKKK